MISSTTSSTTLEPARTFAVSEEQHCFSVGNAQCTKDNAGIVKGTFGSLLNDEMKVIGEAKKLKIWLTKYDNEEDEEGRGGRGGGSTESGCGLFPMGRGQGNYWN